MNRLADYLALVREHFDGFLALEVLPKIRHSYPGQIAEPVAYALESPGKRIRPALFFLIAGVTPEYGQNVQAFQAAFALEAIHTYSLIHDDLPAMDNDELRRNRPTCHVRFSEWAAILAGDALNTLAFETLAQLDIPGSDRLRLIEILAHASGMEGMIGGQALDLHFEKEANWQELPGDTREHLLAEIHLRKTAALIGAATAMGAAFVQKPIDQEQVCQRFGQNLGLLFQLVDDILDTEASTQVLGKTAGKDCNSGKLSAVAASGIETARKRADELLHQCKDQARLLPVADHFLNLALQLSDFIRHRKY